MDVAAALVTRATARNNQKPRNGGTREGMGRVGGTGREDLKGIGNQMVRHCLKKDREMQKYSLRNTDEGKNCIINR